MTCTFSTSEKNDKNFRYRESESNRATAEHLRRELDVRAAQQEEQTSNVEGDLKVEREWRMSLQETMQQDRERISKLQTEISQLKIIAQVNIFIVQNSSMVGTVLFQKYATLQEDYYNLKEQCLEQEHTLEELGSQLSSSKLQISDLKEEVGRNRIDGAWAQDKTATHCKSCGKEFNLTRRKVGRGIASAEDN